jgi:hypothetical protein
VGFLGVDVQSRNEEGHVELARMGDETKEMQRIARVIVKERLICDCLSGQTG